MPLEAMKSASKLLMDCFYPFTQVGEPVGGEDDKPEIDGVTPEVFNTLVETLALSARTQNCLKRAGINRVGEILLLPKSELMKIRGFCEKSLDELYVKLAEKDFFPHQHDTSANDE